MCPQNITEHVTSQLLETVPVTTGIPVCTYSWAHKWHCLWQLPIKSVGNSGVSCIQSWCVFDGSEMSDLQIPEQRFRKDTLLNLSRHHFQYRKPPQGAGMVQCCILLWKPANQLKLKPQMLGTSWWCCCMASFSVLALKMICFTLLGTVVLSYLALSQRKDTRIWMIIFFQTHSFSLGLLCLFSQTLTRTPFPN